MVKPIPEGLRSLTLQLTVEGAMEALAFYEKAFGAERGQVAMDPSGKKVWHAQMRIGDSAFFLNDSQPEMGAPANIARTWIYSADCDGLFNRAIAAGAKQVMAPADMFWGDRIAQVVDRWGNVWSLATHIADPTPAEMQAAQDKQFGSKK